ncbi:MAG TPA: maleylpyruvate isomerase family mycothiol-dependent enzyme [Streptosporangiaceae bacterium]|nr:maleylpyruvate isomerase family mycothiol-dependent enzyme [Streptosporangiaceae bacterium]
MSKATDSLEADRAELLTICAGLSESDWRLPSGCEGWSVQDVVSHMGALFWLVVDRHKLPDNPGTGTEEVQDFYVRQRRSMSPAEVLAEYESVSAEALPRLAGLDDHDFELPLGDLGTYKARVMPNAYSFDHYVHIRMDLFGPRGPLAGPPPRSDERRMAPTLDWVEAALPQQSADALGKLEGSVEFAVTGPGGRTFTAGSGASLGRVTWDGPAFVRAVTQRGGWDGAVIDGAGLTSAMLATLKVF